MQEQIALMERFQRLTKIGRLLDQIPSPSLPDPPEILSHATQLAEARDCAIHEARRAVVSSPSENDCEYCFVEVLDLAVLNPVQRAVEKLFVPIATNPTSRQSVSTELTRDNSECESTRQPDSDNPCKPPPVFDMATTSTLTCPSLSQSPTSLCRQVRQLEDKCRSKHGSSCSHQDDMHLRQHSNLCRHSVSPCRMIQEGP